MINSVSVEEELKKNLKLRKEDIRELRLWCNNQSRLPNFSDSDLALFLHNNYYDISAAKSNIENYHRMRFLVPEFFAERDPINSERLQKVFNTVAIIPLDKLTDEGHKVILAKLIDTNPDNYVYADAVKFFNMVIDLCVYENGTNDGYVFVFDINGTSLKHCSNLSWFNLKKFFEYTKKGSPIRWKGLHYVNSGFFANNIQDFVKSKIVGQKFAETIYLHPNYEKFNSIIPIEILPYEMGGKAGPLMELHKVQIEKLKSRRDWFLSIDSHMMADEKGELKKMNIADIFGENIEIRKLDID